MKPKDVRQRHVKDILQRLNCSVKAKRPKAARFKVGDSVRISKYNRVFKK